MMRRHVLTLAIFASILVFAVAYTVIDRNHPTWSHFSGIDDLKKNSFGTKLYFSIMTQATVGVGDIVPQTTTSRLLVSAQAMTTLLLVLYFVSYADSFHVR